MVQAACPTQYVFKSAALTKFAEGSLQALLLVVIRPRALLGVGICARYEVVDGCLMILQHSCQIRKFHTKEFLEDRKKYKIVFR